MKYAVDRRDLGLEHVFERLHARSGSAAWSSSGASGGSGCRDEPGLGDGELGPALAGPLRQLVHQLDGVRVVVARADVDPALVLEALP